ncbi:putative glycosyl transferase [Bacillus cereus]|nr:MULTISPECIES: glycosyltransferase [Bacillus cereus group]ALZ64270.1 putative glycosyl transferase [Bacillus cereus]ARV95276.1 hypothetical protein BJG91_22485 [Bacillus thuringiensis]MDZ4490609.1 glycosyltransferase [Bacillus cereus]MDZ4570070.1 glycosyltransferase [Bacillus cereus]MEB9657321.1 glycosyltransferase [Bacillus cereus]
MRKNKTLVIYRGDIVRESGEQTRLLNIIKSIKNDTDNIALLLIDITKEEIKRNFSILEKEKLTDIKVLKSSGGFLKDYRITKEFIKKNYPMQEINNVILVNSFAQLYAPLFKRNNINIVWSMHGVHEEKLNGSLKSQMRVYVQKRIEARLLRYVNEVIVVSKGMEEYVKSHYNYQDNIIVVPCAVDEDKFFYSNQIRELIRDELKVSNKMVLTYLGLYQKWQCTEELVELFTALKKEHKNMFLMVISPNIIEFNELIKKKNVSEEDYCVLQLPHSEVPKYLMASDLGYIVRRDNIINQTAFPTKFAEYLACGCPVVVNKEVGDYGKYVSEKNIGLSIDVDRMDMQEIHSFINDYMVAQKEIKEKCEEVAKKDLSWGAFQKNVVNVLK